MASRLHKRLAYIAFVLFFVLGIVIVENRPHRSKDHSRFYTSIQDIIPHTQGSTEALTKDRSNGNMGDNKLQESINHEDIELDFCTALNPMKGFIDLRGLSNEGIEGKVQQWMTKDHEFGRNFTIGICSSPVKKNILSSESFEDIVNASDVGAYYIDPETQKYVSMGEFSGTPEFKGKKLTLTYENGSFCESIVLADGQRIRRSTILTFTCDREMFNKAHVSYIASAQDCVYMFEIRSHFACTTAAKADNLAAVWIFSFILMSALLVFFSGSLIIKFLKFQLQPNSPTNNSK